MLRRLERRRETLGATTVTMTQLQWISRVMQLSGQRCHGENETCFPTHYFNWLGTYHLSIHSFVHSFIHSFVRSFVHSFIAAPTAAGCSLFTAAVLISSFVSSQFSPLAHRPMFVLVSHILVGLAVFQKTTR